MRIHTITAELLRPGPKHNQLVSPLTLYLGVCGDQPAGTVRLPYEHLALKGILEELAYRVSAESGDSRRAALIERTGREIARVLGSIPGLAGVLTARDEDVLVHLRIVLSASELALVPFELTQLPAQGDEMASGPLAFRSPAPVCITRHVRSVSWASPWPLRPRLLFVAGPDVPFGQHRDALLRELRPWSDDPERHGWLRVLDRPSIDELGEACRVAAQEDVPFTHVHVLAHGGRLDPDDPHAPVGVVLGDDAISGDRLANALSATGSDRACRPSVVTLAACESAEQPDVRGADASVAHALHEAGIPLVVASQFPLSVAGSLPLVRCFFRGLLWGEHPLHALTEARRALHIRSGNRVHDWASLVAYEALPVDLEARLEDLRYWQARRAHGLALDEMEAAARSAGKGDGEPALDALDEAIARVDRRDRRLSDSGPYAAECAGLRGAAAKRVAEAVLVLAARAASAAVRERLLGLCHARLEAAARAYGEAAERLLRSSGDTVHRKANVHWLVGSVVSLDTFLGRPLDTELWGVARLAAEIDESLASPSDRSWAHASLAELHLIRLAATDAPEEREELTRIARDHAERLVRLSGRDSEQARGTHRQVKRYLSPWGDDELEDLRQRLGVPPRDRWRGKNGLLQTARELEEILRPFDRSGAVVPTAVAPRERGHGVPARRSAAPAPRPRTLRAGTRDGSVLTVEMLPAAGGDCLWVEYGDTARPRRVLIDCGVSGTADEVIKRLRTIGGGGRPALELLVLTHIDCDHINGAVRLFQDADARAELGGVWFNGFRQLEGFLGVRQAEHFSRLIEASGLSWNREAGRNRSGHPLPFVVPDEGPLPRFELDGGLVLTLLSPGPEQLAGMARSWQRVLAELEREEPKLGRRPPPPPVEDFEAFALEPLAAARTAADRSVANGSSIAFLAEYAGRSVLFTGDAFASVLARSLQRLQQERGTAGRPLAVDALKLSHHGGANANTKALLKALTCRRYLVSTDGSGHHHPDREAMARVILFGGDEPILCFNHRSRYTEMWEHPSLRRRYHYRTEMPEAGHAGLVVRLGESE